MKTDPNSIDQLAELARLSFDEEERSRIQKDLEGMIGLVDKLKELDMSGVEPLIHMTDEENDLRPDDPGSGMNREEALKNAPHKDSDYFRVPKVIERKSSE